MRNATSCVYETGLSFSPAMAPHPISPDIVLFSPAPANGLRETILVVDDEPAVRMVLKIVLEKSGFQVIVASDGAEALETFERMREQIRVIITDMAMPGMNGLDLIRFIREFDEAVDIVATTGMTTPDQMQAIRDAGVRHVLSKPCGSRKMLDLIRDLFSKQ